MSSTNNSPVLFIARVFPNIHEKRIRGIIGALKIGSVDRVDMKAWTNKEGKSFNKVYIHLNWNTDAETIKIVNRLKDGKDIKIVYDDVVQFNSNRQKLGGRFAAAARAGHRKTHRIGPSRRIAVYWILGGAAVAIAKIPQPTGNVANGSVCETYFQEVRAEAKTRQRYCTIYQS